MCSHCPHRRHLRRLLDPEALDACLVPLALLRPTGQLWIRSTALERVSHSQCPLCRPCTLRPSLPRDRPCQPGLLDRGFHLWGEHVSLVLLKLYRI